LEGMQSSGPSAPFQLCWGSSHPRCFAAQARYRVTTDGAWVLPGAGWQAPGAPGARCRAHGRRDARRLAGRDAGGLDLHDLGGPTPRAGYDLTVTRAPEENLRSAPAGALIGKLPQGFLLNKVAEGTSGRWIHVTRAGWVEKTDLETVAQVGELADGECPILHVFGVNRTPGPRPGAPGTPGHGPGVGQPDTNPNPSAPVDPSRVASARRTILYRAPEGQPTGTLAPSAPLRVLGRSGEWTRVELEGW